MLNKIEEDDSELGFKKLENNMSRTDGVAGFLSPIHVSLAKGRGKKVMRGGSIDDISDQDATEYNQAEDGEEESEEEYEVVNGVRRKKRRLRKKLNDIRLDAEPIYLQRLNAPHQAKKEDKNQKNLRKKKKKNTSSMQQLQKMDEDNDVYDLDF